MNEWALSLLNSYCLFGSVPLTRSCLTALFISNIYIGKNIISSMKKREKKKRERYNASTTAAEAIVHSSSSNNITNRVTHTAREEVTGTSTTKTKAIGRRRRQNKPRILEWKAADVIRAKERELALK
jgi:hypothetical protein